ncbi:biopolymer transporter ExbD [Thiomicrospira sp. XS5]|uniref:ExbD/TolR family protein n=1 Tax=Thiomicrospira sp. XS5 TaxID=1775636 RepID=UPI00074A74B0|nr:biopolymer transporter ExbD [Thiomicrospira sp. XS5]KUJ75845.1 biopolymer transporter ExbD [Thiomicrospira sp. XS5]
MKRFDQINVIPMIDVMLVLLAIVLTSASFIVQDKLGIDLPETQETQSYQPPETIDIRLAIDADNRFYLNDNAIALTELESALLAADPDKPIEIRVDRATDFGYFTQLIDLLKKHQLHNLNILTRKQNG